MIVVKIRAFPVPCSAIVNDDIFPPVAGHSRIVDCLADGTGSGKPPAAVFTDPVLPSVSVAGFLNYGFRRRLACRRKNQPRSFFGFGWELRLWLASLPRLEVVVTAGSGVVGLGLGVDGLGVFLQLTPEAVGRGRWSVRGSGRSSRCSSGSAGRNRLCGGVAGTGVSLGDGVGLGTISIAGDSSERVLLAVSPAPSLRPERMSSEDIKKQ